MTATWKTVPMPDCYACGRPLPRAGHGAYETTPGRYRHATGRCLQAWDGFWEARPHFYSGDTLARHLAAQRTA